MGRAVTMLISLIWSSTASPGDLHIPTTQQLIDFQVPSSAEISPNGRLVAYTVRETHWAENSYGMQLGLADIKNGRTFQLTNFKGVNRSQHWSPDGHSLTVARLLPPESAPVQTVSQELGVSVATLEKWRADALTMHS